jgi:hypothetical protein
MRTARMALAAAVVALLAACGSSGPKSNGEASKSPAQVLADAKQAAADATGVHVFGRLAASGQPIKLDMTTSGKNGRGTMSESGLSFDFVRVGDKVYIRGSDAFWKRFGGAAAAQLLHGRWLVASATKGPLASIATLTSIGRLFQQASAGHAKLVNGGETTYRDQKVVAIRDTSKGGTLYVAATGAPYPVAIVRAGAGNNGAVVFDDWNASLAVTAPKNAVDLSKLSGG